MATKGIINWSQTPGTNNSADSAVNWLEGQAPSSVNDSARGQMASTAMYRDDVSGSLTTGGSATAYTLAPNQDIGSLSVLDGKEIAFTVHTTSGATPTLNVNSLGAKNIRHATGATLPTGALVSGSVYRVKYSNANSEFLLMNQLGVLPASLVTTAAIADSAVTTAKINDGAITAAKIAGSLFPFSSGMANGTIVESHTGNAVTFAIKTLAGTDPTASDKVTFFFRSATVGSGSYSAIDVTAALSFTISSGSTMGFSNTTAGRLWLLAINNAGTVELAAINCLSTTSIYKLNGWGIISTTGEGGAGAADSAQVPYSTTSRSSVAYIPIGYAAWESGLTTAGTWNASPDRIQILGPGVPLPGTVIQTQRTDTGAVATGSTTVPLDDTIPQNTEGDQYMSQAITPTSGANLLKINARGQFANTTASTDLIVSLFRDSVANALATSAVFQSGTASVPIEIPIETVQLAGSTSATTFKLRAGGHSAGNMTFNGTGGSRLFGGVNNSFMEAIELMA